MLQLPMRIYGVRSSEFKVKVRSGLTTRPVFMKRDAIMVFNIAEKEIVISYTNYSTVIKADKVSQMPPIAPRGNMLRFVVGERNEEEMILEFEDRDNMLNAYNILRSTFLSPSQFLVSAKSRGLYSNVPQQEISDRVKVHVTSRESRLKELIEMFEKLGPSSTAKRPRTSEPKQESAKESPKPEVHSTSSPLRPMQPERIPVDKQPAPSKLLHELLKESPKPEKYSTSSPLRPMQPEKIPVNEQISVECRPAPQPSETSPEVIVLSEDERSNQPFLKKEDPGQSGFANIGNTCYMNSMLQALFGMEFFTKELFKFCKEIQDRRVDLTSVMPMSLAVSSLASLRDVATSEEKTELLRAIKDASLFRGNAQQDANEFLIRVLSQIQDECDKMLNQYYRSLNATEKRFKNPVTANFAFTMRSTISCEGCHHISEVEEDNTILPVDIVGLDRANRQSSGDPSLLTSLQTLLDEYLETEIIERKCEHCAGKTGQRTLKFVSLPRCLIIFSKRYVYDAWRSIKRDDRIDIPKYITLQGHCADAYSSYPPVPPSTLEIDFSTASPLVRRWSVAALPTSSTARRRLDFSEEVKAGTTSHDGSPSFAQEQGRGQIGSQSSMEIGRNISNSSTIKESTAGRVGERSLVRKNSYDSSDSLTPEDEDDECEVARGRISDDDDDDSCFNEQTSSYSSGDGCEKVNRWLQKKPKYKREFKSEVRYGSLDPIEYRNAMPSVIDDGSEIDVKEMVDILANGNIEGTSGIIEEDNLLRNDGKSELMNGFHENCKFLSPAMDEGARNCKLPHPETQDVAMNTSDKRKNDGMSGNMSTGGSAGTRSLSSDNGEIVGEFSAEKIPYKPLDIVKREEFCVQMGLKFIFDCLERTNIRVMSPQDRPSIIGNVIGDGNCLFRALCFYLSGSDADYMEVRRRIVEFEMEHCAEFMSLKDYSEERWKEHIGNLVDDATWGTEIELFAFAAMLKVDVWTYYGGRWLNYRPMFEVQNDEAIAIPICDYRVGENEGIYLINEDEHYAPVLHPSNAIFLKEIKEMRNSKLVSNVDSGYMLPSYRLLSVISHLGQTSEFGHYICDVWNKRTGWLLCDDESVVLTNETKIRERSNVGYIYLYLNKEIFE